LRLCLYEAKMARPIKYVSGYMDQHARTPLTPHDGIKIYRIIMRAIENYKKYDYYDEFLHMIYEYYFTYCYCPFRIEKINNHTTYYVHWRLFEQLAAARKHKHGDFLLNFIYRYLVKYDPLFTIIHRDKFKWTQKIKQHNPYGRIPIHLQ